MLLFNMNVLEAHPTVNFAAKFPGIVESADNKHLACSSCSETVGFVEATNPLSMSVASLVSTQQ